MAVFSFTAARRQLRIKQEVFERLLKELDYPKFGEDAPDPSRGYGAAVQVYRRNIRIDPSITCGGDLWDLIGERGWRIEGDAGIERYRLLRRALATLDVEHPPEAALAVLAANGGKRLKKHDAYKRLGGSFGTMDAVMATIDAALGNRERQQSRARSAREVELSDFVSRNPSSRSWRAPAWTRSSRAGRRRRPGRWAARSS